MRFTLLQPLVHSVRRHVFLVGKRSSPVATTLVSAPSSICWSSAFQFQSSSRTFSTSPDASPHTSFKSIEDEIEDANRKQGLVKVRETADGRGYGVFANQSFQLGDLVMESHVLDRFTEPTSHTVQLDWDKHVEIDLPARFVNHRCGDANVGIRPNAHEAYNFVALRPIEEGEEVLWDYEASEYHVKENFSCSCGSPDCRGKIRGYKFHGGMVEARYGKEFIAPYLFSKQKQEK